MAQNKVKWEQGSNEVLSPFGTVEIHSDEGDVIGFVFPQYAGIVQAAPDLLAALEAIREQTALATLGPVFTFGNRLANIDELAEAAIAKARGNA